MATIINNPSTSEGEGSGSAVVLAILVGVLILGGLFVMYRLPAFQGENAGSGTTIEVPDTVQVDVTGPAAGANESAN